METATSTQVQRRRQFIVNKTFQHRVIWRFALTVIGSILLSQALILAYLKLKDVVSPNSNTLIYFSSSLNPTLAFTRVIEVIWLPLLLSSVLVVVFVALSAMYFSHRIAGPLFNLKRMLSQVGEGRLNLHMHIRKNDEFHDIEETFNQMVANLNSRLQLIFQNHQALPAASRKKLDKVWESIQLETNEPNNYLQ